MTLSLAHRRQPVMGAAAIGNPQPPTVHHGVAVVWRMSRSMIFISLTISQRRNLALLQARASPYASWQVHAAVCWRVGQPSAGQIMLNGVSCHGFRLTPAHQCWCSRSFARFLSHTYDLGTEYRFLWPETTDDYPEKQKLPARSMGCSALVHMSPGIHVARPHQLSGTSRPAML